MVLANRRIALFVLAQGLLAIPSLAQWQPTNGPVGARVNCLASVGSVVFVGTEGGGVFRSNDNGSTWNAASTGLTNAYVNCILAHSGTLFAGTDGDGVFRSTDGGDSWNVSNNGLTGLFVKTLFSDGPDLFIGSIGGVFHSTDNGANWTPRYRESATRGPSSLYASESPIPGPAATPLFKCEASAASLLMSTRRALLPSKAPRTSEVFSGFIVR